MCAVQLSTPQTVKHHLHLGLIATSLSCVRHLIHNPAWMISPQYSWLGRRRGAPLSGIPGEFLCLVLPFFTIRPLSAHGLHFCLHPACSIPYQSFCLPPPHIPKRAISHLALLGPVVRCLAFAKTSPSTNKFIIAHPVFGPHPAVRSFPSHSVAIVTHSSACPKTRYQRP